MPKDTPDATWYPYISPRKGPGFYTIMDGRQQALGMSLGICIILYMVKLGEIYLGTKDWE